MLHQCHCAWRKSRPEYIHYSPFWRRKVTSIMLHKAAAPEARENLQTKAWSQAWLGCKEKLSMNAKTGLRCHWRIYECALTTAADARTKSIRRLNIGTNTLITHNTSRNRVQSWMTEVGLQLPCALCRRRNPTWLRGYEGITCITYSKSWSVEQRISQDMGKCWKMPKYIVWSTVYLELSSCNLDQIFTLLHCWKIADTAQWVVGIFYLMRDLLRRVVHQVVWSSNLHPNLPKTKEASFGNPFLTTSVK